VIHRLAIVGHGSDDLATLPIRRYEGEVLLVATPRDRERAVEDIRQESVVG
jgi:hypothetical protein